jgi:hypothetical protein
MWPRPYLVSEEDLASLQTGGLWHLPQARKSAAIYCLSSCARLVQSVRFRGIFPRFYAPAARAFFELRFRGSPSKSSASAMQYMLSRSHILQRAMNAWGGFVTSDSTPSCRLATFAETAIGSPHQM